MSYCVNCGVELSQSEKSCPLCYTPVINPNAGTPDPDSAQYPAYQPPVVQKVSKNSVLSLITIIFLLPAVLSVYCDISLAGAMTWSGYVVGAFAVLYLAIVPPVAITDLHPIFAILINAATVILYVLFIEHITHGTWFLSFAVPLVAMLTVTAIIIILLVRTRLSRLCVAAISLALLGVLCLCIELLLNNAFSLRDELIWSAYPLIAQCIISAALFVINFSEPLKERLKRKFFI